jgi:hypothetical protein
MHRFIPALAAWYGASICEIPIKNVHRERGKSHYGIGRTFRVFFDLLTIRFLLRYMTRPLHFFGVFGALGMLFGSAVALFLAALKLFTHQHVQMLAIGLLGELQVRHYHTGSQRAPYTIDRLVRLRAPGEPSMLQED